MPRADYSDSMAWMITPAASRSITCSVFEDRKMPAYKPAPSPLRVLVIGAGPTTVGAHLPVLRQLRDRGEIVLAVICDIEPKRASSARQAFGFQESSGDARAAVARDDIDAVYVFGSAQLHYECGLAALTSGK